MSSPTWCPGWSHQKSARDPHERAERSQAVTNLAVTLDHHPDAELDSVLLGDAGSSSTVIRRLIGSGRGKLAIVLLAILLIIVVFGPTLAPDNPTIQNPAVVNLLPWLFGGTTAHLL